MVLVAATELAGIARAKRGMGEIAKLARRSASAVNCTAAKPGPPATMVPLLTMFRLLPSTLPPHALA
ncbi:hypothetical protein D9X30_3689 [Cupriavidus sp. U2]|nr:hypothetical protein D9X30_3689 [Cupriavidus sp. U2]